MDANRLACENLSFSYGDAPVLQGVGFEAAPGAVTTLLGANACGKTTLLMLLTKNLTPSAGRVTLGGQDLRSVGLRDFARNVAIVHQKNTAPEDLTVGKLVEYGRLPHSSMFRGLTGADYESVSRAMEATGVLELAHREMGKLSGGQRQRAFIAMALAQETRILLLDEPTTFLDVRYQVEILRLIRKLNRDRGLTIVMVLHDINQALMYSDEVIGLKDGGILVQGKPGDVISSDAIRQLYGVALEVKTDEAGRKFVLPV